MKTRTSSALLPQRSPDRAPSLAWQQTNDGYRSSPRDDDREQLKNGTSTSDAVTFRHKLMKRPRSPHSHANDASSSSGVLPPIHNTGGGTTPMMPVQERQQRQMRSFLQNFLADESGRFQPVIDLQQHALDTGITVTDATLQEVVNAVPTLRGLKLTGCAQITDAGIWAIARQCSQLDTIYLAQCERVTELGLRLLAHNCQLVVVDLSDCPQITDTILQALAAGCWMIQTFIMKRCQRITDAGIVKIAQCCKDLRHLDVSECEHVGEYGDKALIEISKYCSKLTVLDLFGCRHVHDAGVRAIARGCPLLTTLKLTGCRDVSSVAIRALANQCHQLQTLSLAGCIKTTNQDLRDIATKCSNISWLDISGSPNIDVHGVRALAQHCKNLTYLSLADCQCISNAALNELAKSTVSKPLATLSLANCPRITEAGVDALTSACTNLVTLDLTGCEQIGRRFLQKLIYKLEFVEWATAFFGFQPLPNAAELCRLRDQRLLELRSAIKIQSAMRGCISRGGLWEAKLKYVEKRILPKIQARIRGFLARKRLALEKHYVLQDRAARVIGREYRNLQLRRMLARYRRLRRIQENEEEAALIFQKLFRSYQGRKRVRLMREDIHRQRQFEARIHVMRDIAAIKLQRAYRGHRGRSEAAMLNAACKAKRMQLEKEKQSAMYLQRVYRGHRGRQLRAQRLAELLYQKQQHDGATKMQKVFRGHRGRRNALILREEAKDLQLINAAMTIQRYWRGIRQKHLSAVLLGLIKLRAREHQAAHSIQAAYRMHMSRGFMKTMKLTILAQCKRLEAATNIQRVLRGHRGRADCEVQRELRKLEAQAKPLFAKEARLAALLDDQRDRVESLGRKMHADEDEERILTLELEKTMKIKTKYHDSSRITGTPQRYLTQYLQVQLADQLRAKRIEIALDARSMETLTTTLNDTEKQLRVVKRALEPLTDGVIKKTKENRCKRLQETVRHQRRAATAIQRIFRGYRVRCAVREGGNCWIRMWVTEENGAPGQEYYYNAFTGVTRWSRPLAMDIFHDDFAKPIEIEDVQQDTLVSERQEQGAQAPATGTSRASSARTDGAWYEAFDDALQATYYFHSGTKEYQWDRPVNLDTSFFTESLSSRKRKEWIDEQVEDLDELLATTIVRGSLLGQWEKRVEPISEHFFFYHPPTRAVRASLSPRSVHASINDNTSVAMQSTRRSARNVSYSGDGSVSTRPLHWQYRYGYEYDATGKLVQSSRQRPVWTEHLDPESGLMYYFNALTNEYRWEKPEDFNATYEQFASQPNSSREWFKSQQQQLQQASGGDMEAAATSSRMLTSRSVRTRALGKKWVEYVDPETQNTYYYNEITGETRWSLSPRSARDTSDSDDQISLALYAQVKQLREAPVPYSARESHMSWLESTLAEKDWKKADALVQQIFLREQSQVVAEKKTSKKEGGVGQRIPNDIEAVSAPANAAQTQDLSSGDAFSAEQATTGCESAGDGVSVPVVETESVAVETSQQSTSLWAAFEDDAGNTFYFNEQTGKTSWTNPAEESNGGDSAASDDWQIAYDSDGNAYYYNVATGETSWTDPAASTAYY